MGTVERGEMLRNVRGTGTLVPEQIRWITATTSGTVEKIVILPGTTVAPDTVIVELSNPEVEQQAIEARLQLDAQLARYESRQVALDSQVLTQEAALQSAETALTLAEYEAELDEALFKDELVSELQLRQKQSAVSQRRIQRDIEQRRLQIQTDSVKTELAADQAEVDRLQTIYQLRQEQLADLQVKAGNDGVLQEVPLDEGMNVTPGTNLARVSDPTQLMAELRIAEDAGQGTSWSASRRRSTPATGSSRDA